MGEEEARKGSTDESSPDGILLLYIIDYLREASSRGVKVVIATGKTPPAAIALLDMVGLASRNGIASEYSPGVFIQGLLVYGKEGQEIHKTNLDPHVCREKVVFLDTAEGVAGTLRPYGKQQQEVVPVLSEYRKICLKLYHLLLLRAVE